METFVILAIFLFEKSIFKMTRCIDGRYFNGYLTDC